MDVVIKLAMKPLPEDKRKYLRPSVSATRQYSPPVCPCACARFSHLCLFSPFIITLLITSTAIVFPAWVELIFTKIKQHGNRKYDTICFSTSKQCFSRYVSITMITSYLGIYAAEQGDHVVASFALYNVCILAPVLIS